MAIETIKTYFHMPKGKLFEMELINPEKLSDEAVGMLRYFGTEHEITADINLKDGTYTITHLDGRKIED